MKNPFERFSPRTIKFYFSILFILTLILTTYNALSILILNVISNDECAWRPIGGKPHALLITDVVPGGVTDRAGIKDGDILLKLNGQEFSASPSDTSRPYCMSIVNPVARGDSVTYLVERNGVQFETKVQMLKVFNTVYLANYLLGLGFLIVGFIVVISKPKGKTQRVFAYFCIFSMLLFGLPSIDVQTVAGGNRILMTTYLITAFCARAFSPAMFLNFFYYFPVYRKPSWVKKFLIILTLINLALTTVLYFSQNYLRDNLFLYGLLVNIPFAFFIAGLIIFSIRYYKLVPEDRRKSLHPILIFSLVAVLAYAYMLIVNQIQPFVIFIKPEYLLPTLLFITLPIAFGYSIFKYRLMDTHLVVKKSIIYATITAALAAVYFLLVFGAGSLLGSVLGQEKNMTMSIIAFVIIALMFDPLKRFVQEWVDTVFYRERYNYQKTLMEFSKNLPLQVDLKQIIKSVADTVSATMHVEKIAVVLFDEKNNLCISRNIPEEDCRFNGNIEGIKNLLKDTKEPQNLSVLREEYSERKINKHEIDLITRSGVELVVPVMLQDKLLGVINAGRKLSDEYYSQEDINLLSTVASQTAIAVENARLYEKEKSLYRVQQELKLASKIQLEWLPKSAPVIPGYDIAGKTFPAEVVGGDYFDFIDVDAEHLAVCVGDVSGKGLPAALLMANLQAILRSRAFVAKDPAQCIAGTNRFLYQSSRSDMFVTLLYGILNKAKSEFVYTNAGHNYPLLFRASGDLIKLQTGGLVLGIDENTSYTSGKITLHPGDLMVIYSDGITEEYNGGGEFFGEERLISLLQKFSSLKSHEIIDSVIKELKKFANYAPPHDDTTMVVIKT